MALAGAKADVNTQMQVRGMNSRMSRIMEIAKICYYAWNSDLFSALVLDFLKGTCFAFYWIELDDGTTSCCSSISLVSKFYSIIHLMYMVRV